MQKKKQVYIIIIIIFNIIIHAEVPYTHDRTTELEILENIDYESMRSTFDLGIRYIYEYSINNGELFIICQHLDEKSIDNKIRIQVPNSNIDGGMVASVEVFNSNGIHQGSIGKINSYVNGGIVEPAYMKYNDSIIYILDFATKRINTFRSRGNVFDFEYSIYYDEYFVGYIIEIIDNKIFTSNPRQFLSNHENSGVVYEIIDDHEYDNSMDIKEITQFIPVDEFRSFFGYDDNTNLDSIGDLTPSMIEIIKTRGLYTKVHYETDLKNNIYAINAFGTEINKFDSNFNIIGKNKIKAFEEIRLEERNIKEKSSSHWNDLYSECNGVFYKENTNTIILYYRFSKDMSEIKGFSRALLFLSADTLEPTSDIIPINFIPIQVNNKTNEMIAFNFINEQPVIEFYEVHK